ncbi:MAG: hypothetical protein AAFV43_06610 [Planctomycetota bacterium]
MNSPSNPTHDEWSPCQSGELEGLRGSLVRANRSRKTARALVTGGYATAACLALFAVGFLLNGGSAAVPAMSCQACYARFDAYHGHVTDDTPMRAELVAQVEQHLDECEMCRGKFEKRYPDVLAVSLAAAAPLVFFATRWRVGSR